MESSRETLAVAKRRDPGAVRAVQVGLLIACLGAVLTLFDLFGLAVVGLFLAAIGVAIAAPGALGERWYWGVALGAVVMIVSRLVAESAEVIGGWLGVAGCLAVLISTCLGFPTAGDDADL
jgi:hypothetical protein